MSSSNRDKLRAGLSGLLATPPPSEADEARVPPSAAGSHLTAQSSASPLEEGEHVRTTTGYVRADGEPVHRVSIMLTKAQRRRLRELAEDEGVSQTDLVVRALGL